jgi:demethylmenaquinone methyltransferase/2-methoxy-6-polyprenyl-1,4-benzoquinol methylase
MLISELLPTLLLPIKANSGKSFLGNVSMLGKDPLNSTLMLLGNFYLILIFAVSFHKSITNLSLTAIKPIQNSEKSKKQQVEEMFDSISKRYDFLNHFLSLGIDKGWRRKAIAKLKPHNPQIILDVATGTADLALEALTLNPSKIIGVDLSEGMLSMGRKKIEEKRKSQIIELHKGDSEKLLYQNDYFDACTVGFGVRNFENLELGLSEIYRVLKPGAKLVVLEFSKPTSFPIKQLYNFYFQTILPVWGRFISKDNAAYTYLPESVKHFPDGDKFIQVLNKIGFKSADCQTLTFGICSIYTGVK